MSAFDPKRTSVEWRTAAVQQLEISALLPFKRRHHKATQVGNLPNAKSLFTRQIAHCSEGNYRCYGGVDGQKAHLGTETVKITALAVNTPGAIPASFNVASRDQFNIVRVGLNYQFH
jgi:hypothetical protein